MTISILIGCDKRFRRSCHNFIRNIVLWHVGWTATALKKRISIPPTIWDFSPTHEQVKASIVIKNSNTSLPMFFNVSRRPTKLGLANNPLDHEDLLTLVNAAVGVIGGGSNDVNI